MMIARETIDRIMDAVRIEEVVGDFLTLKRRGANMLGNCPFHNEKTPSFTVSPAKGIYKCFGCGKAGNSVNFIMEHEHIAYPEALRYLAKKYNIEIAEAEGPSAEELQERNFHDSLYIVNLFAQKFYTQQLMETEAGQSIGLTYFKERGFSNEIIELFQLGYAPDSPDAFSNAALKAGYQLDVMRKAGLTSDKYDKPLDFFRDRVQFTIHNFLGKVVGFGGRTLKTDKKIPKYVNTPETEVYNKSKILYGLFFAKNEVRKQDECIMVEGYTDVISMFQAGVQNVVSSSGTSLTVEQIRLIKRLTPNITILYDGDAAGIKAALRGIDLVLEEDMNVRVVLLPPEHDPDSFIRANGAAAFTEYKKANQEDFIVFKAKYLLKDIENEPIKKSEAIKDIIQSISLVPDTITRTLFVTECSQLLAIDERLLTNEVNKARRKKLGKTENIPAEQLQPLEANDELVEHEQEKQFAGPTAIERQERDIIRLLLEYGNGKVQAESDLLWAQQILHEIEATQETTFTDPAATYILQAFFNAVQAMQPLPDIKHFTNHEDKAISQLAIELTHTRYELSQNWEAMHNILLNPQHITTRKDVISTTARYKILRLEMLYKENRAQAKAAIEANSEEQLLMCLQKEAQLNELKLELGKVLGTVIIS